MRLRVILAVAVVLGAAGQVEAIPIRPSMSESVDASIVLNDRIERAARQSWAFLGALLDGLNATRRKPGFDSPPVIRGIRGTLDLHPRVSMADSAFETLQHWPAPGRRNGVARALVETPEEEPGAADGAMGDASASVAFDITTRFPSFNFTPFTPHCNDYYGLVGCPNALPTISTAGVGTIGDYGYVGSASFSLIPEPSTVLLVAGGLGVLALRQRAQRPAA